MYLRRNKTRKIYLNYFRTIRFLSSLFSIITTNPSLSRVFDRNNQNYMNGSVKNVTRLIAKKRLLSSFTPHRVVSNRTSWIHFIYRQVSFTESLVSLRSVLFNSFTVADPISWTFNFLATVKYNLLHTNVKHNMYIYCLRWLIFVLAFLNNESVTLKESRLPASVT